MGKLGRVATLNPIHPGSVLRGLGAKPGFLIARTGLGSRVKGMRVIRVSLGFSYPKTPSMQIVPTLGLKSINGTYFGLFGVLG